MLDVVKLYKRLRVSGGSMYGSRILKNNKKYNIGPIEDMGLVKVNFIDSKKIAIGQTNVSHLSLSKKNKKVRKSYLDYIYKKKNISLLYKKGSITKSNSNNSVNCSIYLLSKK